MLAGSGMRTSVAPADDPLCCDDIDPPAGAHDYCPRSFSRLDIRNDEPRQMRQHLCSRAEPDRIGPRHPVAVGDEIAAPDRVYRQHERRDHGEADEEALDVEYLAVASWPDIEMSHPQPRHRDDQSKRDEDSTGSAVPAAMPAADARR